LPKHKDIIISMSNLAEVLLDLNRLIEAEVLSREALNLSRENLLPNDPDIGISMITLGSALNKLNRLEEAEVLYREAHNFFKANL
jgi:hypothetical protein